MKKIDLHTHTIRTPHDIDFTFEISKINEYINKQNIDALAITNHNIFNLKQYHDIQEKSNALIIPGIEVDLESGHILVLSDPSDVLDFSERCEQVNATIKTQNDTMSLHDFKRIFTELSKYILIPHYDKKPIVPENIIKALGKNITAGEVNSPKKFIYCKKDNSQLVPVYFSDMRFSDDIKSFPIRQTYLNIGEVNFNAIKYALRDRHKVFLTDHAESYFQANDNDLILSTGLNVVIGERSSGKSFLLNQLESNFERVKYIKQFSLVEYSDDENDERFSNILKQKQSLFVQDFLKEFRTVVDDISSIDLDHDERALDKYLSSLLQHAAEHEKADAFSKASLFAETEFSINNLENLKKLIESSINLIENEEYRLIIEEHIPISSIKNLTIALIECFEKNKEDELAKTWANSLLSSIKRELQRRTAATPIPEIDFFTIALNREKITRFEEVVRILKDSREIFRQEVQNFKIIAQTKQYQGAGELKNQSGRKVSFLAAFQEYRYPYKFLLQLRRIDTVPASDYYKFFVEIEYKILNKYDFPVSGGERSEFRLLNEISDALQFDMLLIDEPESSFDNVFLNSEVNQLIKDISQKLPVILVTHNSTVGASIKPDFLIHTKRNVSPETRMVSYEIYTGHPSDKLLRSRGGLTVENHSILLNCLEAGISAYSDRGTTYETLKN